MHTSRLRLIVFVVFFIGFISTVSAVLFFTFGYRFNFDRGIFVYTGSITVKSIPTDVTISVDGTRADDGKVNIINDSIHVTGITPGEHFLRIEADGYRPWEKKIRVESGVSTEFWNVILVQEAYDVRRIAAGPYRGIYPSRNGQLVALSGVADGESVIVVTDLGSGERRQVFSSREYAFADPDSGNIEWSPDDGSLAVPIKKGGIGAVALVRVATGESSIILSTGPIPATGVRFPRFHPDRDGELVYLDGTTLRSVNMDFPGLSTVMAEGIASFDISGRTLYTLDIGNGIVSRSGFTTPLESDPVFDPIPIAPDDVRLVIYDRGRAAAYREGSGGWLLRSGREPLSFGNSVRTVQFSDDGKKLLITESDEVSVLFSEKWEVQPARENGERHQILRLAAGIRSAVWTEDYEHVLFSSQSGLSIAELDPRGGRIIQDIVDVVPVGPLVTIFGDNLILFLDGTDATVGLDAITFPRSQPLFGS